MKKNIILSLVLLSILLSGCTVMLQPTEITGNDKDNVKNYKYFYMNPSGMKTGSSGFVMGSAYGVYGTSYSKTTDPCDIISGYLIKMGYVRVATIDEDIKDQVLVISYGETGRRYVSSGYTIQVTIQFTSAKTHEVVCTVMGEGTGNTEADDIRIAITRCLDTAYGIAPPAEEDLDHTY